MNVWPLPRITIDSLKNIEEQRPAALITHPSVWADVSQSLHLPLVIQAEPPRKDADFVEYLANNLPAPVEVVYAVGDGHLLDVAKVVAAMNDRPLVIVPTAISSDAPFSPAASLHRDGKPTFEETGAAEEVVVDFDLIQKAAPEVRAAAIADLLSIVTGLLDWGYAQQKGKTTPETKLVPWALSLAAGLASQAIKIAPALGKGDPEALHTLVDLLCMMLQLDGQLGHRRVSQGIEHIFADAVPADSSVSHAERIAPGILISSALYNKDVVGLRTALEGAGVRLNQLKVDDVRATLNTLPDTAKQENAPYSILNDLAPNAPELEQALYKAGILLATK